jgi:hypothetical protein
MSHHYTEQHAHKEPLVSSQDESVWHVYTNEQFVILPLRKCVIIGQLKGQSMPSSCVCISPVELPLQGLYAAAVVSKVIRKPRLKKGKKFPRIINFRV